MKSKPQKLEKGTFDDQLRYLLKKYSGLELRKAITTLCEEEVREARIDELSKFEYNWTEGLSDTQRYKTLGNAVTVNVVEAVISSLMDTLNTEVIDISTQEGCDRLNELTKKKGKL